MNKFVILIITLSLSVVLQGQNHNNKPQYSARINHTLQTPKLYPTNTPSEDTLAKKIDNYAKEVMKLWELPGFALSVSVDNKVILSKGYGSKENRPPDGIGFKGVRYNDRSITSGGVKGVVNTPNEPIDSKTIFQIGSVSKSFTAIIMADLVAEKKIKWTDTVANILPDFKIFKDGEYVSKNLLVRDCFLHSTGLANEAGTYFGNLGYDRKDTYKLLARLEPGFSFRSAYDYNNITFVIASEIIEKITGKSWEENLQERVLIPLQMTDTKANADGYALSENVATPHDWRYDGKINVSPLYADEQALHWLTVIGPAGGISSNVEDMIRYAQFHCNNGYIVNRDSYGKIIDTTYIKSRTEIAPLHRGYTITSQDSTRTTLYGLCWFIEQNNRYRLYFHTGTTWGMTAICFFVPEIKLAGIMLVNSEVNANPRYAMMRKIIDFVMREDSLKDYNKDFYNDYITSRKKAIEGQQSQSKKTSIDKNNKSKFVGRYTKDELLGDIYITLEKGELYIETSKKKGVAGFKNQLKYVKGNTYNFRRDGYGFNVTFISDNDNITGLMMEFGEGEENSIGGWKKE